MTPPTSNVVSFSGRTERHRAGRSPRPVTTNAVATAHLTQRGYVILYRHGQVNHCPGCGKTNWWIGNRSAQCAFCDTVLDLQRV